MDIEVPERQLEESERKALIQAAIAELEESYLGENESPDAIRKDLHLVQNLQDGKVQASWNFQPTKYLDDQGRLLDEIPKEGVLVMAKVELTCQKQEEIYEFPIRLLPREREGMEQILFELNKFWKEDGAKEGSSYLVLPRELQGERLRWKGKKSKKMVLFFFLACLMVFLLELEKVTKKQEEKKRREKDLLLAYPEMVNQMALLMGAGMTMRRAWGKIVENYELQKQRGQKMEHPLYEEMRICFRQMQDGTSERKAYRDFAERCHLQIYRRFVSLLCQNLQKGSGNMLDFLGQEVEQAFELRKNTAKKLGEEAGTKLLMPMVMMLAVVIIMIMVPAILSFHI